jgi:ribosomal protein S18 acetylase RimI-like enzyme
MNLKATELYLIENTSTSDLDFIYTIFEEAITYIKKNNYVGWSTYDKNFIKQDIDKNLQFKITIGNDILCVFSICFSDVLIWREMEKGDAIYIHRIVVNPKFKGQKQFEKILNWIKELANKKELKYIRMDTWADNSNIIEYYKKYGFQFLENYTTPNTPKLPDQHRNLKVALLEIKL